ncbi:hypothetical protein KK466_29755, partial [Klebsiella pneumoniae]|uniref:hypothetical protein n=1 Tax=Klebsiella pneumoniae TaxID=573 RepID=UPI001BDFAF65
YRQVIPSLAKRGIPLEVLEINQRDEDWRDLIKGYLENTNQEVPRRIKLQAIHYILYQEELFRKTAKGLLLRCIDDT